MPRGKFITFEGGEGAGKSTQVRNLAAFFRRRGIDALQTREVGGAPAADAIRDLWLTKGEGYWDPLSELLLIMAARREHLVKTIWPALDKGVWVISDRFADSTRVYQGLGLDLGMAVVEDSYQQIAGPFEPDLTVLLDLPVDAGLARIAQRGDQDDRYQQKNKEFHQKLRDGYLTLAQENKHRFRVIDAAQNTAKVGEAIEKAICEHFTL